LVVSTLTAVIRACGVVLILAAVASLGMTLIARLIASKRTVWLVFGSAMAQAAALPAMVFALVGYLGTNPGGLSGLALVAVCAAGPAGMRVARRSACENRPEVVSAVVVVQMTEVVTAPVSIGWVAAGAAPPVRLINGSLWWLVVLPVLIGALVAACYRRPSKRWDMPPDRVAAVAVGIALIVGVLTNWDAIAGVRGSWHLMASLLVAVLVCGVAGLAGAHSATTSPLHLMSGLRMVALLLIVIGASGDGVTNYLGPAAVYSLADLTVLSLIAYEIRRQVRPTPSSASGEDERRLSSTALLVPAPDEYRVGQSRLPI